MYGNERFCTAAKKAFIAMQIRRLGQTPKVCFTKMNKNERQSGNYPKARNQMIIN
jgi:hypothetical protein